MTNRAEGKRDFTRTKLFANFLWKARLRRGLTQSQVAVRIDRHHSVVTRAEAGQSSLEVMELVAAGIGYRMEIRLVPYDDSEDTVVI